MPLEPVLRCEGTEGLSQYITDDLQPFLRTGIAAVVVNTASALTENWPDQSAQIAEIART